MSDHGLPPSLRPHERTRLSADQRRLLLVQAAYHLIAEKGLLGLRIRDVADRVGVNHTTLVYHFPTKESLIAAVIAHVGTLFLTTHAPECSHEATPSPRDRLHCYFVNVAYQLRTAPEHFLVIDELFLQAQRDPVLRHLLRAEEEWVAYLTSILEDGIQQNIFVPTISTTTIVQAIMTFCKGLPLQMTSPAADAAPVIQQFEQWVLLTLLPH